jgi:PadR family transcriptional regulator AphA
MSERARTPYILLGLLCHEPMTGYELNATIQSTVGHFWQESFGQLYPTLKDLHARGLVSMSASAAGGRDRKVYTITDDGRAALFRWLAEPPQPSVVRSELLLKVFLASLGGVDDLRPHLEAAVRAANAQITHLTAVRAAVDAEPATEHQRRCWLLTVDLGLRSAEATRAWAERALSEGT